MSGDTAVSELWRRKRSWRLRASLVIVPLALLGTLVLSAPAYALTLNGNEAPAIQSLSMYPLDMLLMNLPTEYDVVAGSAGATNISDQQVSSVTTDQQRTGTNRSWVPATPGLDPTITTPATTIWVNVPWHCNLWVPSDAASGMGNSAATGARMICEDPILAHTVITQVPSSARQVFGIGSGGYYQTTTYTYSVPIVTTVTNENIHITNAKLLSVQPEIIGINTNTSRAEGLNLQGPACSTPTTALWNPVTHTMPYDYSLHPWLYSQYFSSLGICNINPAFLNTSIFNSWLSVAGKVQFNIAPYWQLTASFTVVTTVNGGVTNSVPGSSVQNVLAPWYYGPVLPVRAITAVPCEVTNGVSICPNGQTSPMPQ